MTEKRLLFELDKEFDDPDEEEEDLESRDKQINDIKNVINKIKSYKKTLLAIKILGNVTWIVLLILQQYFNTFLVWFFFCPDLDEIYKFVRKVLVTLRITYGIMRMGKGFI